MPGVGIYAASKRGLEAAFDSLRLELAPAGINVSLVMPGMFETEGLTMDGIIFDGDIPASDTPTSSRVGSRSLPIRSPTASPTSSGCRTASVSTSSWSGRRDS